MMRNWKRNSYDDVLQVVEALKNYYYLLGCAGDWSIFIIGFSGFWSTATIEWPLMRTMTGDWSLTNSQPIYQFIRRQVNPYIRVDLWFVNQYIKVDLWTNIWKLNNEQVAHVNPNIFHIWTLNRKLTGKMYFLVDTLSENTLLENKLPDFLVRSCLRITLTKCLKGLLNCFL